MIPGTTPEDYPDGEAAAAEWVTLSTHNGTHLDAPYHFHSTQDAKNGGSRPSITIDQVNDAATDVLKNRHFNDLFKYARTERRRFILALCHREADGPDPLRLPVIREKLSAHGIEVSEEGLAADLEWLTDLELLDFSGANGGESYSLTVPLMGLWIDTLDYTGLMSKAREESAEMEEVEDE